MDEVFDFGVGGVLTAGAEEVAEGGEGDAAVTTLVEEGEGFFVVGCCLGGVSSFSRCCYPYSGLRGGDWRGVPFWRVCGSCIIGSWREAWMRLRW